jgi:hypothetical protein
MSSEVSDSDSVSTQPTHTERLEVVAEEPHRIRIGTIIGIIVAILVVLIGGQIIGAFVGAAKNVGKIFTSVFGAGASALSWASSHWYLFLAALLIAPFVPAGARWAAKKWSDTKKLKVDAKTQTAMEDAIIREEKLDAASKETDPETRKQEQETAAEAEARLKDEMEDPEVKESVEDTAKKVDVDLP